MQDIIKMGEELHARVVRETDSMIAERSMMRDIVESRGRELIAKRDEELHRIDAWAKSQKDIVRDVFTAMISENDADKAKHEVALKRLMGEAPPENAAGIGHNYMPRPNVTRER
jgi:hypothetical protein